MSKDPEHPRETLAKKQMECSWTLSCDTDPGLSLGVPFHLPTELTPFPQADVCFNSREPCSDVLLR